MKIKYPTLENSKKQTLEIAIHTCNTIDGRETQSIYPPCSTLVNLKDGEQQAKTAPFKTNFPIELVLTK